MAVDMFHYNEIARAIRLVCRGAVALTADASGTSEVSVGSNELFEAGQEVTVCDSNGEESATVADTVGLTTVVLSSALNGTYAVSRGARIERASGDAMDLQWVGQGSPELMPRLPGRRYPCVLVKPDIMQQPLNEGSNRTFQQDYHLKVYYVERYEDGEDANIDALERAGALFNLIMEDPYLGGSCWHSQVIEVDPEPAVQQALREEERGLRVVEMTVLARRAAVFTG